MHKQSPYWPHLPAATASCWSKPSLQMHCEHFARSNFEFSKEFLNNFWEDQSHVRSAVALLQQEVV